MVERMGNPSKDEGEWIAKIDLVESGKLLKLKEQEDLGKCGSECRTIQKAVEEILEEHDTDIAERLWQVKCCPLSRLKGIPKALLLAILIEKPLTWSAQMQGSRGAVYLPF